MPLNHTIGVAYLLSQVVMVAIAIMMAFFANGGSTQALKRALGLIAQLCWLRGLYEERTGGSHQPGGLVSQESHSR